MFQVIPDLFALSHGEVDQGAQEGHNDSHPDIDHVFIKFLHAAMPSVLELFIDRPRFSKLFHDIS